MVGCFRQFRENAHHITILEDSLGDVILPPIEILKCFAQHLIISDLLIQLYLEVLSYFGFVILYVLFLFLHFHVPLLLLRFLSLFLIIIKATEHVEHLVDVLPLVLGSGE